MKIMRRLYLFWEWGLSEWALDCYGQRYWDEASECKPNPVRWNLLIGPLEIMWLKPKRATEGEQ